MNCARRVEGDVVSVSGPVNVAGGVTGVITAVSERVTLTPTARAATCSKRGDPLTPGAAVRMARTNSVPDRVLQDVAARTACIASRANNADRMHPGLQLATAGLS